jgi:hypothetical protein
MEAYVDGLNLRVRARASIVVGAAASATAVEMPPGATVSAVQASVVHYMNDTRDEKTD